MNKRLLSVLAFALVISAVASVVLYRLIASGLATNARAATNQIVVATHNLEVGSLLKDLDLKTVDWTGPEPKSALTNRDDIIGRGVIATIYEGEPILETRLAGKGAGAGLASTIPSGMRAVTGRLEIRFRKAAPMDATLIARGRLDSKRGRVLMLSATVTGADGTLYAEGQGRFVADDAGGR